MELLKGAVYALVALFFFALLTGWVLGHVPMRQPDTSGEVRRGSLVADLQFDIDQHYRWGLTGRTRPNLRGMVYADDLGPTQGAGLEMCSTDYYHSRCSWHPRVPFSDRSRSLHVQIYNQLNPIEAVANVTIPLDASTYELHILESGGPFVRGGILRYDADPSHTYLPP